jgi:DNA-directed RNA polymerase specialized sigma24 family protein
MSQGRFTRAPAGAGPSWRARLRLSTRFCYSVRVQSLSEQNLQASPAGARFADTLWSQLKLAEQGDSSAREHFCRRYWYPLYAFLRRKGYSPDSASDLVQAFLAGFLDKNRLSGADAGKGKFRTLLLTSLEHFANDVRDRELAVKRGGRMAFVPLDVFGAEEMFAEEPKDTHDPAQAFEWNWATALFEQAFASLRQKVMKKGDGDFFDFVAPAIRGTEKPDYDAITRRWGLTAGTARVTINRLRNSYREQIRAEIAETVSSRAEAEEELAYLYRVVSRA